MAGTKFQANKPSPRTVETVIADILGTPGENTNDVLFDFKCNGGIVRVRRGVANHDAAFVYTKDQPANDNNAGDEPYWLEQDAVFYYHDFTVVRYALKQGENYIANARGTPIFVLKSDDLLNGDDDADWTAASDYAEELAHLIEAAAPGYEPEEATPAPQPPPPPRPSEPPSDMHQEIARFLSRVVPWPENPEDDGSSGYVNVHWTIRYQNGRQGMAGKPVRSVVEFQRLVGWILQRPNPGNIYYCLSLQSECTENESGRLKAVRLAKNALAFKAVWVDLDVKEGGYATIEEAVAALVEFCKHYRLPAPSFVVVSGSGLHVYWVSDHMLSADKWRPYAKGLKAAALEFGLHCDTQCTVNAAQILRVPGTWNYKTDPPKQVFLDPLRGEDIDFAVDLKPLLGLSPARDKANGAGAGPIKVAEKFKHLNPRHTLNDSIDEPTLLPFTPIKAGCGWLSEAHDTGGEAFDNPQWNLMVLCATSMDNGRELAHLLGNQHPKYTIAETDEKFDIKLRERQNNPRLGWPSCEAIKAAGSKHCEICPHRDAGKSPLHLALQWEREKEEEEEDETEAPAQPVDGDTTNPIAALMKLRDEGANTNTLMAALNQNFAVVRRGSKVRVAYITGKNIDFMLFDDFHNMLGNLTSKRTVVVSKRWLKWKYRRQFVGHGVVFEPGGPLEIAGDMLNLWRGFGVEPKQGDWSLMYNHIRDVACRGNEEHFQYTIKWMAYGVQYLDRPVGTMPALRGEEGAGKGIIWRNYGRLYGKHFKHISHGGQLTGRFNAVLGDACFVFLDEAFWAGDRKGEPILRALITEDTFQLELKHFDVITVKNRLRTAAAGNSQWIVPVSPRGRRNFVLDAGNQYANENDPAHAVYWGPLQKQFGDYAPDDGRAAMLYDLLDMDLKGFNILAVPKSAAKTEQKLLTQTGTAAWLFEILQEGAIHAIFKSVYQSNVFKEWNAKGMEIARDDAYQAYLQFSQEQREYKPRSKEWWSRDLRKILGGCISVVRPWAKGVDRTRYLVFYPLEECRRAYGEYLEAEDIEWSR